MRLFLISLFILTSFNSFSRTHLSGVLIYDKFKQPISIINNGHDYVMKLGEDCLFDIRTITSPQGVRSRDGVIHAFKSSCSKKSLIYKDLARAFNISIYYRFSDSKKLVGEFRSRLKDKKVKGLLEMKLEGN